MIQGSLLKHSFGPVDPIISYTLRSKIDLVVRILFNFFDKIGPKTWEKKSINPLKIRPVDKLRKTIFNIYSL